MSRIKRITREKYIELVSNNYHKDMVVQIDGKFCRNLKDYFTFIWQRLNFPTYEIRHSYPGYEDWMRDVGFFPNEKIHFIILNYDMFLSEDAEEKRNIMEDFECFYSWWEHDVIDCVVGGKPKEFNVYIVED